MADFEATDSELPWEYYTLDGIAKKGKKAKKDKKWKKDKSGIAIKADDRIQKKKKKKKKKKNSKLREASKGNKVKKRKGEKDKTMTLSVEEEASLKVDETLTKKSAGSHPHGHEQALLDGAHSILTHRKVRKTNKKLGIDLGFTSSVGEYPKAAFPSTQLNVSCARQSVVSMGSDVSVAGALRRQCNTQPQGKNESQCTSDDINSQDLFITQKTFSVPSSYQSSGKITEGLPTMPHFHQYGEMHAMVIHRHKEPKTQHGNHREAFEELSQLTNKMSTKKHKLRSRLQLEAKKIQPAPAKPKRNIYIGSPIKLISSTEVKKLPDLRVSNKANLEPLQTYQFSTADNSTQTENFFTTELCRYYKFYQQMKLDSTQTEVIALDLRLPWRKRTEDENRVSTLDSFKTSALDVKGVTGAIVRQTSPGFCSTFRPKKQKGFSVPAQVEVETTPSPQSEAELNSSETTVSSEDNEASCHCGRVDLMRVKAVQMRLNESFFFKSKGEGQAFRPESPLMKLIQGRERKTKKQ